jgi:FkbM family methyltransferase
VPIPTTTTPPAPQDRIGLAASGATMFLLPGDKRAESLRRMRGATQPRILRLWTRLIDRFAPDLILDIGANHGEMSLPLRIPAACRIVLAEPNPALARVLARSVASHPDAARFAIRAAAVSDHPGRLPLHVDEKWSGTSSLDFRAADAGFKGPGTQSHTEIEVEVTTLDALMAEACPEPRLMAIKVDVEGHEERVVQGAAAVLARPFFMVLEFNRAHLRAAGSQPARFLGRLRASGRVLGIGNDGIARIDPGADLPAGITDLLLTNVDAVSEACMA